MLAFLTCHSAVLFSLACFRCVSSRSGALLNGSRTLSALACFVSKAFVGIHMFQPYHCISAVSAHVFCLLVCPARLRFRRLDVFWCVTTYSMRKHGRKGRWGEKYCQQTSHLAAMPPPFAASRPPVWNLAACVWRLAAAGFHLSVYPAFVS